MKKYFKMANLLTNTKYLNIRKFHFKGETIVTKVVTKRVQSFFFKECKITVLKLIVQ